MDLSQVSFKNELYSPNIGKMNNLWTFNRILWNVTDRHEYMVSIHSDTAHTKRAKFSRS